MFTNLKMLYMLLRYATYGQSCLNEIIWFVVVAALLSVN